MERKCSHMWKCFILCTFNPQDSTAAKDRDSHEGVKKKSNVCKSILYISLTVVMKENWVIRMVNNNQELFFS